MQRLPFAIARRLLGCLLLAAPLHLACAQGAAQSGLRRAEELSNRSRGLLSKENEPGRSDSKPRTAKHEPGAASRHARRAPAVVPVVPGELAKLSRAELEALIAKHRDVVKTAPRDDLTRHNLGRISIEAANRVLRAQSLGRTREVSDYAELIGNSLADTLWRVTRISREEPARGLAALGLYYSDGILVPADPARGCDYFAKAAAAGHAAASYRTFQCLSKAEPQAARRWLERSAAAGDPAAQEALGRACIEGARRDAACAKKWLEPAAAQGRVGAISVLGWLAASEGTPESLVRALKLYRSAAQAGDVAAQNNLGELLETGRGLAREPTQALEWYRKSARSGFAPAQFNLARMFAFGNGTERDAATARTWASKALAQGIAQAKELLKLIADAEKPR